MPTLYGAPISPFVRKTMVALAEKGVTYEHDPVVPAIAPAEFKRISKAIFAQPLKKVKFAIRSQLVAGFRPVPGLSAEVLAA